MKRIYTNGVIEYSTYNPNPLGRPKGIKTIKKPNNNEYLSVKQMKEQLRRRDAILRKLDINPSQWITLTQRDHELMFDVK